MSEEDEDKLARYLSHVRGLALVFPGEEPDLLAASRNGDEATRKLLVEGYLELAALLAIRLAPIDMRPLDAIQEANVVLMRLLDDTSVAEPARELTHALVRHYEEVQRRQHPDQDA